MIDQLGEYETVAYDVEEGDDGAKVLSMTAQRKGWGPGYLRFGIFVEKTLRLDRYCVLHDLARRGVEDE